LRSPEISLLSSLLAKVTRVPAQEDIEAEIHEILPFLRFYYPDWNFILVADWLRRNGARLGFLSAALSSSHGRYSEQGIEKLLQPPSLKMASPWLWRRNGKNASIPSCPRSFPPIDSVEACPEIPSSQEEPTPHGPEESRRVSSDQDATTDLLREIERLVISIMALTQHQRCDKCCFDIEFDDPMFQFVQARVFEKLNLIAGTLACDICSTFAHSLHRIRDHGAQMERARAGRIRTQEARDIISGSGRAVVRVSSPSDRA
jgi:hypothetical protein